LTLLAAARAATGKVLATSKTITPAVA
jgi:hypothetical protein